MIATTSHTALPVLALGTLSSTRECVPSAPACRGCPRRSGNCAAHDAIAHEGATHDACSPIGPARALLEPAHRAAA